MKSNQFIDKRDFSHILILLTIALGVGIYLIFTTVLISKDGIVYIERAQVFSSNPIEIIKSVAYPFGYPFLIFAVHKFVMLWCNHSTVLTWIYTAQSVTLICRLIALIILYFIGKLLVGSRRSFWAILILVILPYPAEFGSDVLRDWPHILFLTAGFLLLLRGAKKGTCWMFGAVGLVSGFGHMIRPECAQLVIYGALWITIRLLFPKNNMSRTKLFCALFILLMGFTILVIPYVSVKGKILPEKLEQLFSSSDLKHSENIQIPKTESNNNTYKASVLPIKIFKAIGRVIGEISDNLLYYFFLPLVIGIYSSFRRKSDAKDIERFFISALVSFNIIMLILLYFDWGFISRRHCLPLVVFLVFYVPAGLEILARWFSDRSSRSKIPADRQSQLYFFVLLAIGVGICMPKLLRPLGSDKPGYRAAARWLKDNTRQEDVIAVPDLRISFYAERKGLKYVTEVPEGTEYLVKIVKNGGEETDSNIIGREEYSVWVENQKKSNKKLLIYKMM